MWSLQVSSFQHAVHACRHQQTPPKGGAECRHQGIATDCPTPLLKDNCGCPNHHNGCRRAKAEVVLLTVTPEKRKSFSGAAFANGITEFGAVFVSIIQLEIMTWIFSYSVTCEILTMNYIDQTHRQSTFWYCRNHHSIHVKLNMQNACSYQLVLN